MGSFASGRFFELDDTSFLHRDEPVWEGLARLGTHLADILTPNVAAVPRAGGLVTDTVALVDGRVVPNVTVRAWDASKGKLEVEADGERLEDAAVVCSGAFFADERIEIGPGVLVETGAYLRGPVRVGACSEVRQGAYLRGTVLVGSGCVVGHATEVKGSVFLDGAKAGHFAYVGDSILGHDVNLGAGTKLANLKIIPGTVTFSWQGQRVDTGRRKLGAILGDGTETGCNSVLGPGALLGRACRVFPNVSVGPGVYADKSTLRPRRQ